MKKHKKFNSILAAATFCVMSAGATVALAQTATTDQPENQTQPTTASATASCQSDVANNCSHLIGTKVENQQGQKLGKIIDVVVSPDNQRISYCVLSVRHGMFMKDKYLAVPRAAFQPGADESHLILNASRANLAKATGVDRNQLPSANIPVWGAEPGAPAELPPVVVFAPTVTPPPAQTPEQAVGYPWAPEPIWSSPPVYATASEAMRSAQFQSGFGYRLMPH
jgi:hypothetical protein